MSPALDLHRIAKIILDFHAEGADNDCSCDDLLDILRKENPAL